jgi:hypothetical protein
MKKWSVGLMMVMTALIALAQEKSKNNTLLWQISGNGLPRPSYLFGTYTYDLF